MDHPKTETSYSISPTTEIIRQDDKPKKGLTTTVHGHLSKENASRFSSVKISSSSSGGRNGADKLPAV